MTVLYTHIMQTVQKRLVELGMNYILNILVSAIQESLSAWTGEYLNMVDVSWKICILHVVDETVTK